MQNKTYTQAAVVLAGSPPCHAAADALRTLAADPHTLLLAADGGADAFAALALTPHLILGDGDSQRTERFADMPHLRYPCRKDFTDGEAALRYAAEHCTGTIHVFGALGGRPDHLLGNLLLPLHALADPARVRVVDDGCTACYVTGRTVLQGCPGDLLSLLALTPVTGLTLDGTEYPLDGADVPVGSSLTLSNVFAKEQVSIEHRGGCLLAFHMPQR